MPRDANDALGYAVAELIAIGNLDRHIAYIAIVIGRRMTTPAYREWIAKHREELDRDP